MNKHLHPPKQDRSRETQARILQATAGILVKESFESISVRRIVYEAGTSIGSFYARFPDKNALLSVLYAEYEEQLQVRLVQLEESVANARSLEEIAELIVHHFVATFGEIPNLSRALYEYAARSPKRSESKKFALRRQKQYSFLLDALLSFRAEITHSDPERAVNLGLYFVTVTCRNRLLYPLAPQTRTLKISKEELKLELVRMLIGYLCN